MLITSFKTGFAAILLVTVAACSQAPAQIDLKGQNSYSRNGSSGYTNNNASISNDTVQAAPVYNPTANNVSAPTSKVSSSSAINSNDLTPLTAGSHVATNDPASATPFQRAHPDTLKPAAGGAVNQWTNKPRSSLDDQSFNLRPQSGAASAVHEQMVSDVNKAQEAPVAQLDSVIDNDGETRKATAAITKPVKSELASSGGNNLMWPVSSKKVISEFGPKGKGKANDGINIASADGEPVWAAADGEVLYVGNELQGYGNMILIKHAGDKSTTYAHLGRATVDKYDRVKQGDIIGYVGSTGSVKEPQLHFAVRDGKDAVDPLKYLNRKVASAE